VCCSVLQCVAVCCSVLQCVAVCCSVLQCVAVCSGALQCIAVCCSLFHANKSPHTVGQIKFLKKQLTTRLTIEHRHRPDV